MKTPTPSRPPVLVKIGGALVADPARMTAFWKGVRHLGETRPVVIVHGGGPQATAAARRLGHEPHIVHGRRVTTARDLEALTWAVRGGLSTALVSQAAAHGLRAAGLSGADGGLLRVSKRPPWQIDGTTVDFGWVGDVEGVDPGVLHAVLGAGVVPLVGPLGIDAAGQVYNVNADTVALALARALGAAALLLVTAAGGVRRRAHDPKSRLARCDRATFDAGLAAGWIAGGMRVKLNIAFDALDAGVKSVFILPPESLVTLQQATEVVR